MLLVAGLEVLQRKRKRVLDGAVNFYRVIVPAVWDASVISIVAIIVGDEATRPSQCTIFGDTLCSDATAGCHLDIKSLTGGSLLSGSFSEKSAFIIRAARHLRLIIEIQRMEMKMISKMTCILRVSGTRPYMLQIG